MQYVHILSNHISFVTSMHSNMALESRFVTSMHSNVALESSFVTSMHSNVALESSVVASMHSNVALESSYMQTKLDKIKQTYFAVKLILNMTSLGYTRVCALLVYRLSWGYPGLANHTYITNIVISSIQSYMRGFVSIRC
jgi:hypothetical protein